MAMIADVVSEPVVKLLLGFGKRLGLLWGLAYRLARTLA
jgi:hypothetical protein